MVLLCEQSNKRLKQTEYILPPMMCSWQLIALLLDGLLSFLLQNTVLKVLCFDVMVMNLFTRKSENCTDYILSFFVSNSGVIKLLRKHPNWCLCFQSKCPCWRSSNQINDLETPEIIANTRLQFIQHEHKKPTLGDFTFDEYMEKILQYGFLMVSKEMYMVNLFGLLNIYCPECYRISCSQLCFLPLPFFSL